MTTSNHAICWIVLVEPWQDLNILVSYTEACLSSKTLYLFGANLSTPITHQIADNIEERDDVDTSLTHTIVAHIADQFGGGSGCFDVSPDAVAVFA